MKKHALQVGLIFLSIVVLTGAGLGLFKAAQESGAGNLFDSTSSGQSENVPLSYETRISKGAQLCNTTFFDLAAPNLRWPLKLMTSS